MYFPLAHPLQLPDAEELAPEMYCPFWQVIWDLHDAVRWLELSWYCPLEHPLQLPDAEELAPDRYWVLPHISWALQLKPLLVPEHEPERYSYESHDQLEHVLHVYPWPVVREQTPERNWFVLQLLFAQVEQLDTRPLSTFWNFPPGQFVHLRSAVFESALMY